MNFVHRVRSLWNMSKKVYISSNTSLEFQLCGESRQQQVSLKHGHTIQIEHNLVSKISMKMYIHECVNNQRLNAYLILSVFEGM